MSVDPVSADRLLHPESRPRNAVLQSREEWEEALAEVRRRGLRPHPDAPKNWDALVAYEVARELPPHARVLDAGGAQYSKLLFWLLRAGYTDLWCVNLAFPRLGRLGPIRFVPGDITATGFSAGRFDLVACLSVIEHGVDADAFFAEAARILRPGGTLVVSTDYFPGPTPTDGRRAYGHDVLVYDRATLTALRATASDHGFFPVSQLVEGVPERCVTWERMDLAYTFVVLTWTLTG